MDNNNLTTKGDGTCKPDTEASTNTTNPTNTDADAHDKSKGLQTSELKPMISEARLRANRENAKKSTGPKTSRGKAYSRRNALKHGLLIKRILFSSDGTPINAELHDLWESVQEKYGKGDVRTDLLLENLVVEWWRQRQALDIEIHFLNNSPLDKFSSIGIMPNLQRYRTASQRAFLKNLELLDELPPPTSEGDEDEDEAEGEAPTPQPENPPPALEPTSGLTVVATEQGSPPVGDS